MSGACSQGLRTKWSTGWKKGRYRTGIVRKQALQGGRAMSRSLWGSRGRSRGGSWDAQVGRLEQHPGTGGSEFSSNTPSTRLLSLASGAPRRRQGDPFSSY